MSIIQGVGSGEVSTGFYPFSISQSLRFNDDDSAFLSRTPASASNRKTFTFSCWFKYSHGTGQNIWTAGDDVNNRTHIDFNSDGSFQIESKSGGSEQFKLEGTPLFRDPGAWYNLVWAVDTTASTASDRIKAYINGSQVTFSSANYGSQDIDTAINNTVLHVIGKRSYADSNYFNGYLTEINFIDGQALGPSSFGETKNDIWVAKNTSSLTFGTNGFRLQFLQSGTGTGSSSTVGADTSGKGHHFTSSGIASEDQIPDTPTKNWPTWNPLDKNTAITLSDGNLFASSSTTDDGLRANIAIPHTGKWYWEVTPTVKPNNSMNIGIAKQEASLTTDNIAGQPVTRLAGSNYTQGQVVSVAVDADSQSVEFRVNNSVVSATSTTTFNAGDDFYPYANMATSSAMTLKINFGQLGFTYDPPSGFEALNTANLPDPAIDPAEDETPDQYFDTTTYTANNGTLTITGLEFQPDWVWIKARSLDIAHALFDVVRGTATAGSTNTALGSNRVDTQGNGNGVLSAFTSDGFTVAGGSSGSNPRNLVNKGSNTYVAWSWRAGGTASANTDGSQEVQVSVNTEAKFSIAKFTGTQQVNAPTFGHGLGVAPELIIIKGITEAQGWYVFGDVIGASGSGNFLKWETSAARVTGSASSNVTWNATTIGLDSNTGINASGDTFICYSFASVDGYSKIGSYEGNNSADNAFVYTGFRPAWVMIKNIDASGSWGIWDTKRNTGNVSRTVLYADQSVVENTTASTNDIDILSNGFKVRGSAGFTGDAVTYLYMAFADQPFKYSNAR